MTLDEVQKGQKAKILRNKAKGVVGQRLMDMGFYRGSVVEVVRNAPLVDPVEFLLGTQHITVRHLEASLIEVELI